MLSPEQKHIQQQIIAELGVKSVTKAADELMHRVQFIKDYLRRSGARSLVIGISGGIDSLVVGCMAQRAVEQLRDEGLEAQFIALRLPYGVQADAVDADAAVRHIQPDRVLSINIQAATDAVLHSLRQAGQSFSSAGQQDFVMGNVKARQRMVMCYAVAAANSGLVLGSDHAAEVLMGFFTKYGDGAADLMPLAGLVKEQVRDIAVQLEVPLHLIEKAPTADLESLTPLRPDELAFGLSYKEIDAFLTGHEVSTQAFDIILRHYRSGEHKRQLPASPLSAAH
ncbi:ammonia-dependent NAD(+) synthetase [Paenalcaligenes faecalis]|uniref:ammonia-dependent NAD(+) synthetase n=1 Tax=Paenalcaligenes faecalis TaxID=2980099 RepID=UPI0022B9D04E|nr:ammonia-dependent NAD(+) synthetase [Paenalcaligenes faecalis]